MLVDGSLHIVYADVCSQIRLSHNNIYIYSDGYKPVGWLGFLLGDSEYFNMFGDILSDKSLFKNEMRAIARKLNTMTSRAGRQESYAEGAGMSPDIIYAQPADDDNYEWPAVNNLLVTATGAGTNVSVVANGGVIVPEEAYAVPANETFEDGYGMPEDAYGLGDVNYVLAAAGGPDARLSMQEQGFAPPEFVAAPMFDDTDGVPGVNYVLASAGDPAAGAGAGVIVPEEAYGLPDVNYVLASAGGPPRALSGAGRPSTKSKSAALWKKATTTVIVAGRFKSTTARGT